MREGKLALFEQFKALLAGHPGSRPYGEIARQLNTTEGAVKTAVHRLRRRYRVLLRAEIAETVSEPGDLEDELQQLFAAVGKENH